MQYSFEKHSFLLFISGESHAVTYNANYTQPPVITPSTAPSYNSGRNRHQMPPPVYSNVPSQSYTIQSPSMSSEMYKLVYEPVKPYWLFRDIVETKEIWCGFSTVDSDRLETLFQQGTYFISIIIFICMYNFYSIL